MVAAFAIDWTTGHEPQPAAAATVYLRVRRHGRPVPVTAETLSIGFRATVIEHPGDIPGLLAVVDRALTRARRHALIVAGHALGADLARALDLSQITLRGTTGVEAAWNSRTTRQRGVALMIDTSEEAHHTSIDLELPVDAEPVPLNSTGPGGLARTVLARCLAIGLTAAVHAGRYQLVGDFPVAEAIDRAGWDILNYPRHAAYPPPQPQPVASPHTTPTAR
jgi:hypothetical protein